MYPSGKTQEVTSVLKNAGVDYIRVYSDKMKRWPGAYQRVKICGISHKHFELAKRAFEDAGFVNVRETGGGFDSIGYYRTAPGIAADYLL